MSNSKDFIRNVYNDVNFSDLCEKLQSSAASYKLNPESVVTVSRVYRTIKEDYDLQLLDNQVAVGKMTLLFSGKDEIQIDVTTFGQFQNTIYQRQLGVPINLELNNFIFSRLYFRNLTTVDLDSSSIILDYTIYQFN